MKIKVQIDSVFQEEMLQIQAPSRTPRFNKLSSLSNLWMITNDKRKRWRNLSYRANTISKFTSKIVSSS